MRPTRLTALPLPFTLAAIQLLVGVPYVWMLWLTGVRKAPELSISKVKGTTPVAMAHTMAHLAAVVSIGAGAVGFVQVYTTLLPVVGGVAMASAGEISFSALAFGAAMTSNASAASRSVLGKIFMAKEKENGGAMCAGNLYAVMTMLGCLVLTPAALWVEGPRVASVWNAALSAGHSQRSLVKNVLLSGVFFYLYNEVSFYALNIIHPVTHALGNTLKRVVMIIVSVLVLNHRFTPLGLAGCTTAIGGVMAYSLTKARLEQAGVVVPVGKVAAVKAQLENEAGVAVPVGKAAEVAAAVAAAAKNKKEGATGEEDGSTATEKGG
ncbi:triosephosphate/phosphate translocator [Ectocarpus siliculosus]|uniref:Triosephosphate/phosphate translocator n=1 Tax=Ectocarpus siliculosus TaxID=2880 RepID=D8LKK2_ECTSI|nr:triosephosphate/phosphate translocator [Ectocarpus siliculosus]|eukprot:CBN74592.1 triosephosphate/phosphate translocator [Ectocarpus siliculosus]